MRIRLKTKSSLRKKAKLGHRGYPLATIAFYGPTADRASKVAVGIIEQDGAEPSVLERWLSDETDVRHDSDIEAAILAFIQEHGVVSVVMTDGLLGCPHEEGIDYPEGQDCPQCPYWAGRDRFARQGSDDRRHASSRGRITNSRASAAVTGGSCGPRGGRLRKA